MITQNTRLPDVIGNAYFKPIVEWLMWMILVMIALSQVDNFSQEMATYRFDADGWPITIMLALGTGATLQFLFQIIKIRTAGVRTVDQTVTEVKNKEAPSQKTKIINGAIFLLPFVYLFLAPRMGIYVITPFFIVSLLLLLNVRSIKALLGVTVITYMLLLLVFTRFFYVALPVGRWDYFYDLNNWIIVATRIGF